jgi:tetratricopeptide (TPR) repeat protein
VGSIALLIGAGAPAYGQVVAGVKGKVTDPAGQPLEKVELAMETVRVEGRPTGTVVGKVKSRKNGTFTFPFLDPGEYKLTPTLAGYAPLQMKVLSVDSQKNVHMDQTFLIKRDQSNLPTIPVKPQGQGALVSGKCEVNLIMVVEADFSAELAKLQQGEGKAAAPTTAVVSHQRDPVERGDEYLAGGDLDQAAAAYREGLEADPTRADAHYGLGKVLLRKDDLSGALTSLKKAEELDPTKVGVEFYLGAVYHALGQDKAAIEALEKERVNTPDSEQTLVNLGTLYRDSKQYDKALGILDEVVRVNPDNSDAYLAMADAYNQMKQPAKAEEIYKKILAKSPGQEDVIWYNIGVNAFNADRREAAAEAFRKSVEANPKNSDAHYMLANCLYGLGQNKEAATHYRAYLKLEPKGGYAGDVTALLKQIDG